MKIGRRYSADPPLCLRRKRLRLVVARRRRDDVIAVFVDRACRGRSQLRLFLCLLFDLSDLLALSRRSRDFHAKDDVTNFRLCQ